VHPADLSSGSTPSRSGVGICAPGPLAERRAFVEDQLDAHKMVLPCRRLPDDGVKAWAIVEERGYEGMIAKDPRSTYRSSTRSWMKVKVRHEGFTSARTRGGDRGLERISERRRSPALRRRTLFFLRCLGGRSRFTALAWRARVDLVVALFWQSAEQ
jgi:hypothetical protein